MQNMKAKYDNYLSLGSRAVYCITYGHHGINESNWFIMWRVLKWEMRWDKVWPSQAHVFCNPIGFIQQPTWALSSWSTRGNWWGRDGPHFNLLKIFSRVLENRVFYLGRWLYIHTYACMEGSLFCGIHKMKVSDYENSSSRIFYLFNWKKSICKK